YVDDSDTMTRGFFSNIENTKDNSSFLYKFTSSDKFGICSVDGKYNMPLPVQVKQGFDARNTVSLNWKPNSYNDLVDGGQYILYYPYSEDVSKGICIFKLQNEEKSVWNFYYSRQKQIGNNNSSIIAKENNYYMSEPFTLHKNTLNPFKGIKVSPVSSIIHIQINLPEGEYIRAGIEDADGKYSLCYLASAINATNCIQFSKYKNLLLQLEDMYVDVDEDKKFRKCDFYIAAYPGSTNNFKVVVTNSDGVTYYSKDTYRLNLEAGKCYFINDVTLDYPNEEGYEYVDLGLPSGLKWATMNVGAICVKDYGDYYAWGETESKNTYSWDTYKWYNTITKSINKYDEDTEDCTLEQDDDVACQNWGGRWHTPTIKDFQELINSCFWVWTEDYLDSGIRGYIVYKAKSPNEAGRFISGPRAFTVSETYWEYRIDVPHIFLPDCGCMIGDDILYPEDYIDSNVFYMSSSLGSDRKKCHLLNLRYDGYDLDCESERSKGYVVRPVFK
ncbi:MAG: hypothetical protein J5663_00585, partial [Bacteroidaceae bacterium]|nr:hypothetical protein [Bacteroidaceae bacterium]